MNNTLNVLQSAIKESELIIAKENAKTKELREKFNEEARQEQRRLIKSFNENKLSKLNKIQERLPDKLVVSGFESDTYLDSDLKIFISSSMYTFDFVLKDGFVKYENRSRNDGVGCKEYQKVIDIIDLILNSK